MCVWVYSIHCIHICICIYLYKYTHMPLMIIKYKVTLHLIQLNYRLTVVINKYL